MPLFNAPPVGLSDYVRVENREPFISTFAWLYSQQTECLYSHSRIFPFSYLNKGQMKLYLNKDCPADHSKIIPIVKQFELTLEHEPTYFIHCPLATTDQILEAVEHLDKHSSVPVIISDVTTAYADKFLLETTGWEKVKTSDDVIQNAEAMATLAGRNFSSLRNTLKHVRNDLKPEIQALNPRNAQDAICVFERWKVTQGLKYFRVTIGRDVRLIEEYADKMDFQNLFGYVYYVQGIASAVSFGCRSNRDPRFGIDITCKALTSCRGLGDFAFVHLCTEMHRHGISYINDSGGQGKVLLNKQKFRPVKTIPCYDLKRKA